MELTIDQLYTYLQCPLKFQLKYVMGIEGEESKNTQYKEALHKTISYFYFSLMGQRMPTAKQMKDKWVSIWTENKIEDKSDFLLRERKANGIGRQETAKLNMQGYEMIHNFYQLNKDEPGIPIAVDHEYRVSIADIIITGKFELIKETIDKTSLTRFIEIVDYKTGNNAIEVDPFLINHDMNITLASYAFRNLFQAKEDRLTYHYLKNSKEIYTSRNENEFNRLKKVIDGVAEGITQGHFYPRHDFMCKVCPVKDVCDRVQCNQ
jgi:CRISPR/Cas system-associated exonuclease Cas4 (RecB family)